MTYSIVAFLITMAVFWVASVLAAYFLGRSDGSRPDGSRLDAWKEALRIAKDRGGKR